MHSRRKSQRGQSLIEFTLCGIPMIFLIISIVHMAFTMWNYHSLAEAVSYATRVAATRGAGCMSPAACQTTVGDIAKLIAAHAVGMTPDSISITLTSADGSSPVSGALVSAHLTDTTPWPSVAANAKDSPITIKATHPLFGPIAMFWPGSKGTLFGPGTLAAQSTQAVVY
jgi:Flp pilus assembly protein TadG